MTETARVLPDDAYNRALVHHVYPEGWLAPTPQPRYNLVVIGGGPAGLVAAMGAAGLGGKVALIERHLLGGDCLNAGCVPSKALLKAMKVARTARHGATYGVNADGVTVDFAAVMERMRRLRSEISHHDSAERFREAGIDVFLGDGHFTGRDTVEVGGTTLRFSKAIIATGAHPFVPPIPGAAEVGVLTNETLFTLTELPRRLAVVGGGVIGSEMAQAFQSFGCEVTVIDQSERLLARGDAEASERLQAAFEDDGVRCLLGAKVAGFERDGDDKVVLAEMNGETVRVSCDAILVAVGRAPNTDGLGLEAAGVKAHRRGIEVDDTLRTANGNIYAIGDVASKYQFTHAADTMARMVLQNALFFGGKKHSALVIPNCTYTTPEIAAIGLTATEAAERPDVREFRADGADLDRTVLDGNDTSFVKVFADKKGRILGASVVGERAGEIINTLSVAMQNGVGLGGLSATTFAYPTESELLKRVGDAFNKTRLTPFAAKALSTILRWRR